VSIFAAVYFLTDGQGVEIVWPSGGNDGGNNNHDNSGSSSPTGSIATERFDVQINLYEGERYFFNVTESGQTERFRAIETVFSEYNATQVCLSVCNFCSTTSSNKLALFFFVEMNLLFRKR
jgi:hypothetical protein